MFKKKTGANDKKSSEKSAPEKSPELSAPSERRLKWEVGKEIEATCLELALEGERLCKSGDCRLGIQFFEAAVHVGTEDLKTLSAIYSQLGNAYFYLQAYSKALDYHRLDLNLARSLGDKLGEAKASGNLGNTLKVLGKFDEAIACCKCHLRIAREMGDKVSEARALYNLGNVCHARGKCAGRTREQDPGEFPPQVKEALTMAANFYQENLAIVRELGDRAAEGRACGNLGNTHYLLGNFYEAIDYHSQRLAIAKESDDIASERRAYSNLGNCYIFLADFETAAENYLHSLDLSRRLGDRTLEAQACYSLGNTYTLLRDYHKAIHYHGLHLNIAREVKDRVGEGRACWSLGNSYMALGQHAKALSLADQHYRISEEVGDESGKKAASMNIMDLRKLIGISDTSRSIESSSLPSDDFEVCDDSTTGEYSDSSSMTSSSRVRRLSMERMELMKLTPNKASASESKNTAKGNATSAAVKVDSGGLIVPPPSPRLNEASRLKPAAEMVSEPLHRDEETLDVDQENQDDFFSLLSKYQSRRMDEQRCSFRVVEDLPSPQPLTTKKAETPTLASASAKKLVLSPAANDFLDYLAGVQGSRMNDQRACLPAPNVGNTLTTSFPGLKASPEVLDRLKGLETGETENVMPDDGFFEMLMRCQATRIEDQRSALPDPRLSHKSRPRAPTVPDEDFFGLIQRVQSNRLEEQRCDPPEGLPAPVTVTKPAPAKKRSSNKRTGTKK